jgi:two-component system phosphate regulon response regulator PhoB
MNPRVLIVEDEQALNLLLRYNLESEGFDVDIVERGDDAETRIRENQPDLLILDWMLPGVSGIEICRLATGADDYVVKPFSLPELLARVHALLRRAKPEQTMKILKSGDLELDREKKRVQRAGRELHLGPTEFRLLEFLMLSPGRVFTREQLLDGVWGREAYIDERTVDVHVGRLRKVLSRGREIDPIRTVRGSGYSFNERFAEVS